ncbi:MAG: helicase-related protein [Nanoarchaeota archaeon]
MKKLQLISNFKPRKYQELIFANSLNKNSLVILPTGLGKTVIAIMLAIYYFNKNPNKKVLFLAPTKPLVEQQEKSFKSFFKNSNEFNFHSLTGTIPPKKRTELYKKNDFIFSTPQLLENDIVNKIVNIDDFSFVIFDEAHRATGNYAYTFVAKQFALHNIKILALTASPGTSKEEIYTIMENLNINHIEVKKKDDKDVKEYTQVTNIKNIEVELNENFKSIRDKLNKVYNKNIKKIQKYGFLKGKSITQIIKKDILDLQKELRVNIATGETHDSIWKTISLSAGLMKLQYGIELLESQEISSAYNYFYNFFRAGGDNSKAVQELLIDINFREAFHDLTNLYKNNVKHPKLIKLKEIVNHEILKNPNLKIIIFNQYRDSATKIVEELSQIKEIKPTLFIGQSKKGEVKLSQKEQKKVIEDFRDGHYNIIVSTSVGEEGLDIPKVDLVIFYEPVPSAIRTIQRIGRTGRFNQGKAYILMSKDTKDIITKHISSAKERKMYRVLDEIIQDSQNTNKEKKITDFISNNNHSSDNNTSINSIDSNNQNNTENNQNNNHNEKSYIPKIYVDNRENNDLIKELFNESEIEIETKKLEIADIVITQHIAIERKSKADFVNSIIDKRLFPQLLNLSKNYRRPLLLLEGEDSIYSIRNISPNVIRATLSAIAIDLRIPIIYSTGIYESSQIIKTITKRAYRTKKDISLAVDKTFHSEYEELEKFVSTIPKINIITAKLLLSNFNSIKKLVNSTQKDLLQIEGIGKIKAQYLIEFFNREYQNKKKV